MRDAASLLWLRGRILRHQAGYWLRSGGGYDPSDRSRSERLYGLYLLALAGAWLAAAGIEAAGLAAQVGQGLGPRARAALLLWVPGTLFVGQLVLLMSALRRSPLQLTFLAMTYLAGSPLSRAAVILVAFAERALLSLLPAVVLAVLAAVALRGVTTLTQAGATVLPVALAAVPLTLFSSALAWCAGVARLRDAEIRQLTWLWLVAPPVLLIPLWWAPHVVAWPYEALGQAMRGQAPAQAIVGLVALAAVAVAALGRLSCGASLTVAADESAVYARVKDLGSLPSREQKLQARARATPPRRLWLHLPGLPGVWVCAARVGLAFLRRPLLLARLPRNGIMLVAGVQIILQHVPASALAGTVATPLAYPWVIWLCFLVLWPLRGMIDGFRGDAENPFMRQFVPANNLALLLADAAPSLVIVVAVTLLGWLAQGGPWANLAAGAALLPVLAVLLLLCQGLSLVLTRPMMTRMPQKMLLLVAFGAVLAAGALYHTPLAPLAVACVTVWAFGGMMRRSV